MVRMLELRPCAKATDLERMSVQSWPSSRHAIAKSMEFFVVKKSAIDAYYRLVRTAPARHLHNRLRRWLHHWRYGVNSVSMFRNVEMEINSTCNRSCWYCPDSFARRPVGYMSDGLFRKIIAELAEMDFDGNVSYHFYGEPLAPALYFGTTTGQLWIGREGGEQWDCLFDSLPPIYNVKVAVV
jgi:sulfatase maturation enzyme AslB (radical SAM superfamily)